MARPRSHRYAYVGVALNRPVHEGINDIANVKVHSGTRSGNVNIRLRTVTNHRLCKVFVDQSMF